MIRNRRQFERNLVENCPCEFKLGENSTAGYLVDTSAMGVRVGGLNLCLLFCNQKVSVQTETGIFVGRCRTVSHEPDGSFQVGIVAVDDGDTEIELASMLINSFIQLDDRKHVCVPIEFKDGFVLVKLLNGQEESAPVEHLTQMTRQERLEELCDRLPLKNALRANRLRGSGNEFENRKLVLSHEFGPPNMPLPAANPEPENVNHEVEAEAS